MMVLTELYEAKGFRFDFPSGSKIAVYCIECKSGIHGATKRCGCCPKCCAFECVCGYPPRGRKLTDRELRAIREVGEDAPRFWRERIGALFDHLAALERERQPMLPWSVR